VFVEQLPQFLEFLFRATVTGKRVEHEIARGAAENALEHVGSKLLLGGPGGVAGFVHMRALIFIAADQTFGSHDLEKFEDAGVADGFTFAERFVNLADGRRTAIPKDAENLEFGGGGFLRLRHARHLTTKIFVLSTKIFVLLETMEMQEG
jgi:hypothetical protein